MRYTILTLFPGLIRPWLSESLLKKAQERGLIQVEVVDLRAYGLGRHRTVDDTPYGGGAGMVIRPDVAVAALEAVLPADEVILLSPAGEPFTQRVVEELAQRDHLVLLSGRYEGFDARVEAFVTRSLSIGDYVLMGGEVAALAVLEATARLIPGVIGDPESHRRDSFVRGLLDHPHYTRPPEFRGLRVPEVLLSGNHPEVDRWRRQEALRKTLSVRPELVREARLGPLEVAWLAEMDREG
ncbi:tRNA (guanosine(37)-N1)-methyltransferase TrmD [Thermus scotoductus]|uniref:tRNA (guanine-N(1)-)-methyltransferase n=1 Tax=Thermus scotoductus TaxID=37636 RepID=A0A430R023_THESC|nr:tRNA (guanosine(37)-N1)-methyltransferase TrmD [Thermus scotoductus]RTG94060.1 tRNA (guanosine(37)-N1)-methyltransferase TrmD [Thermus scotoductus]RTH00744.1 tRNA (guanosine(37)-N1)-methyltransferase TrmD [Thermus scotoductus]RTH19750.1 tRNA (guanosine(37)-N1)-methyltransferase TrmD [Thermus scotoductus]RTH96963.1 tRNA (guanosine(37)-N1)-methyltransferase TrmD [Thermus scotoductus]RTI25273.1 tRNA (guanosine(37)-N1)-methyltransferase TrmD [Thermus scotoductus]